MVTVDEEVVSFARRVRTRDDRRPTELLAVALELESLNVILADQVAKTCLGEANACPDFGRERPGELLGDSVDGLLGLLGVIRFGFVGLCVRRKFGLEERRS